MLSHPSPSTTRSTVGRIVALAAVGTLLLAGCSSDDPASSPGQVDEPTSTAEATPSPLDPGEEPSASTDGARSTPTVTPTSPSSGTAAGVPGLNERCVLEPEQGHIERVEFAAPDGWQVDESSCEFFDPELERLEQGTEPDAAIGVRVADTSYARAAEPGGERRDEIRYVGARSGYQAVRIRAESTGQGLRPEGEQVLTYLVDLDEGNDDQGGTLVLTASRSSGASFALAAEALDRMVDTLRVVPGAPGQQAPVVVTRSEGGGAPYAVTLEDGCLQLRPGGPADPVTDEACDLEPTGGEVTGVVLGEGETTVAAGFAPALSAFVVSDAASAPYGAFTTSLEGGSAFAYDVVDTPVQVRAVSVAGDVLATATLER